MLELAAAARPESGGTAAALMMRAGDDRAIRSAAMLSPGAASGTMAAIGGDAISPRPARRTIVADVHAGRLPSAAGSRASRSSAISAGTGPHAQRCAVQPQRRARRIERPVAPARASRRTMPASTSPVPALASQAGPAPARSPTRPSGCATTLSAPFSSTTAPLRAAAALRAIDLAARQRRRTACANSPSCGVRIGWMRQRSQGARARRPAAPARRHRSPAARARHPARPRAARGAASSRPSPGPTTSAPIRSSVRIASREDPSGAAR